MSKHVFLDFWRLYIGGGGGGGGWGGFRMGGGDKCHTCLVTRYNERYRNVESDRN